MTAHTLDANLLLTECAREHRKIRHSSLNDQLRKKDARQPQKE